MKKLKILIDTSDIFLYKYCLPVSPIFIYWSITFLTCNLSNTCLENAIIVRTCT